MKILKGVVVGCGMIAREHLRAMQSLQNVEIAAVCDLSPARAEAASERFGVKKWYVSVEKMLADIHPDLVHITTSPSSHFAIARICLDSGLNVLCEKPITATYQEFTILRQLAENNNCMLMENQNFRYHSSIRRVAELIESGQVGEVIDISICYALNLFRKGSVFTDENAPHSTMMLRGGVIGDFLPHIAYLSYLFTGPAVSLKSIWAKRHKFSLIPADEFRALVKGEHAIANLAFSGNAQPDALWLRVNGTKMYVECNLFEAPRLIARRVRSGEPAIGAIINGVSESISILHQTFRAFWRKLGGVGSYDGLPELIAATYQGLELQRAQPIPLNELDETSRLLALLSDSKDQI